MDRAVGHEFHAVFDAHFTVDHADKNDNAQIRVIPAVDQHRFQRGVTVAFGRRQFLHNRFERFLDADAGFGGDLDRVGGVDADDILDLFGNAVTFGRGQVDLVEDGHDFVIRVDGLVDVGERLRLHPLGAVDDQKRAFDRAHGAGDLVSEVDVAGRVDEVEDIRLPILGGVFQPHGVGFDGDAAFAFNVHRIQKLRLHIPVRDGIGVLDQAVGERGFPVVDMGHDGEVTNTRKISHSWDM